MLHQRMTTLENNGMISTTLKCPICDSQLKLVHSDSNNDNIYFYTKRNLYVCEECGCIVSAPTHTANGKELRNTSGK